ncbi:hypothetical protein L7F22_042025 [Adiantum nelumboides]|nr:hypothetical protein [Adiantum nelumboides]
MTSRSFSTRRSHSAETANTDQAAFGQPNEVENPNSYGIWGRYEDAPVAIASNENEIHAALQQRYSEEDEPQQRANTSHADRHQGWDTVEMRQNIDPNLVHHSHPHNHHHRFHLPSLHHQEQASAGPNPETQANQPQQQSIQQNQQSSQHLQTPAALYNNHSLETMSDVYPGNAHDISNQYMSRIPDTEDPNTPLVMYSSQPGMGGQHIFVQQQNAGIHPGHSPAHHNHNTSTSSQNESKMHHDVSDPNLANAFDEVHGRSSGHIAQHGHQIPIRIGHLFKRPLIRQWVLQDKVYREIDDREPSQFELFFDLVMVGIIHKLADGAAEAATGLNVAKFILCFYPAWSVWSDTRAYMNVSGTDDVWQRIYTLLIMVLLVGYAANVTGIHIEKEIGETGAAMGEALESTSSEAHRRAWMTAVETIGASVMKRSSSGGGEEAPLKLVEQIGNTPYWFADGWHTAIASAIGFYLVAKGCRLALYFIYGMLLPKFRKALWLNALALLIISCIYLPIMFLDYPGVIVILIAAGVVSELTIRYLVAGILQVMHGRSKHRGHKTYIPAYSLPHMMERTTLFVILVIGETVMNGTFVAGPGEYGPRAEFWRAALSITIAFMLMWIYFDVDSSRTFVHGLKRHWFTSITYTNLHFPLSASLVLMSSTLVTMIGEARVDRAYFWFFAGSIGTSMLCMAVLGMLHKSLDRWGSSLIPKSARIGLRFLLAAVFYVMPLVRDWTSSEYLGMHAALLAFAVAFETFGKLGSVGRVYDPIRAEALRRQRLGLKVQSESVYASGEIPMDQLYHSSSSSPQKSLYAAPYADNVEKSTMPSGGGGHQRQFSVGNILDTGMRKINKDSAVKGPGRRASWHEHDDLTGEETGENDVGVESELGRLESKQVASGERWAYVAS